MNKVYIVGAGGSGKDFLRKKFEKLGHSFAIHYTTRPMRDNEINGVDYYFISKEDFLLKIINKEMVEYTVHGNDWYYGISHEEYSNKSLFILSPLSYLKYSDELKDKALKIFLDIDENIRIERLSKRNDKDSVERRIFTDKRDLEVLESYRNTFDLVIKNSDF